MEEKFKPSPEFHLSTRRFLINLVKLIPKMRRMRKKAERILKEMKEPETNIAAPESKTIQKDLEKICSVPHRRIGTKEAHEIEDFLESTFMDLNLQNVRKEELKIINWVATRWKLIITREREELEVPCFYVLNTRFTGKKGITAPLIYVGSGLKKDFKKVDVKNKIVVADIVFPKLPLGKLLKFAKTYYVSDPQNTINEDTEIMLTFALTNFPPQSLGGSPRRDSVYWRALQGGAIGLILILRDYPSNVNTHWGPYDGAMKDIPGLYVGKYDGMKVRKIAQSNNASGTIILEGYKEKSVAHDVWGILPGKTDDIIMISSHHDSAFEGASEDGTGVAMVLAQLRAWSKIPKEKRPRSLLFLVTTGHLYAGIGAETFTRKYKDSLLKNVLVDVNLEHLCAKEVDEDLETHLFKFTNNLALGAIFISPNYNLIARTIHALKKHKIERMILIPDNFFATPPIGEAGHFVMQCKGLKIIHWIRSPYYLLTAEDTLDKIAMDKLGSTAQAISDMINSLMYMPREQF